MSYFPLRYLARHPAAEKIRLVLPPYDMRVTRLSRIAPLCVGVRQGWGPKARR